MNIRFGAIKIVESDWQPRYDSAALGIELTGKDHKSLPKQIQPGGDRIELTIDRQGELQIQTYWPGSGNKFKLTDESAIRLLRRICSGNDSDVTVLAHSRAINHIKEAIARFDRHLTTIGLRNAEEAKKSRPQ